MICGIEKKEDLQGNLATYMGSAVASLQLDFVNNLGAVTEQFRGCKDRHNSTSAESYTERIEREPTL